jgi:hypothetical protein
MEALPRVVRRPQNTLVIYTEPVVEAYKLLQHDVTRIERRYGTPIDFLGRAKLAAAIRELNLQRLELDGADLREVATVTRLHLALRRPSRRQRHSSPGQPGHPCMSKRLRCL